MSEAIVALDDLTKHYPIRAGILGRQQTVRAVDRVSLVIKKGETFGLVGESGCGKTTIGQLILRLQAPTSGRVLFDGEDIAALKGSGLKAFRRRLQVVFQDPLGSFDPRQKVIDALVEPMLALGAAERPAEATEKAIDLMSKVGLSDEIRSRHASELSGGQRQRVSIARVLCLNPQFIVLDEPTSALDVSVQAQVLNLLKLLKKRHGLTYLLISHNLVVTLYMSDTIAVMYLGKVVELASSDRIFESPMHPYTYALLSAIPLPNPESRSLASVVSGDVPSAVNIPSGCRFHTRCPYATQECGEVEPTLTQIRNNHHVACHHPQAWLTQAAQA